MKSNEKKIFLNSCITIALSTLIALFIMSFIGIMVFSHLNKKNTEAEFLAAIDNCIAVCKENAELVVIPDVDFIGNISMYEENIANQESILAKAYIANAMTTYTIDTFNLNDPKANYELALELGDPVEPVTGRLESYLPYADSVYEAQEAMLTAQENYLSLTSDDTEDTGITEY